MNILQRYWFKFNTGGAEIHEINGGNPVEEVIIRYKGYFLSIMLDGKTGEPTGDFGWSRDAGMFHVPVREFYTAEREG